MMGPIGALLLLYDFGFLDIKEKIGTTDEKLGFLQFLNEQYAKLLN